MNIRRSIQVILAFCLGLLLLEAVAFGVILGRTSPPSHADAIVVFRGGTGQRKAAGIALHQQGRAPHMILSPTGTHQLGGLPSRVAESLIIEDQARTTFENALYTRDIVLSQDIRSVILVTSDYHAPRSYLLLKGLLLGRGVHVSLHQVPTAGNTAIFPPMSVRSLKILYNEMVKFWGSLGEWVAYAVRGRVPEQSTKEMKVLRVMKEMLLFKV